MTILFTLGYGGPLRSPVEFFSNLYLGGAAPVLVGLVGLRLRGVESSYARIDRGMGRLYLAGVPLIVILLSISS